MEYSKREPSRWIFSRELKDSNQLEGSNNDERFRPYIVTPLGTMVKRIMVCGVVASSNSEETSSKIVLSDPVGSFYISASSAGFNELVRGEMKEFSAGDIALVMGRVTHFKTDEGAFMFTVNPERIWPATDLIKKFWNSRSLRIASRRLLAIREAQKVPNPTPATLSRLGYAREEAEFAIKAVTRYPEYDFGKLLETISTSVSKDQSGEIAEAKKVIMEIIKKHEGDPRGVSYEEIASEASSFGIEKKTVDDSLNSLGNDGDIYEVSLKRFKAI